MHVLNNVTNIVKVALVAAILLPIGVNLLLDVDTTAWPTTLQTIWDNIPVIALAGVAIGFLAWFDRKGKA